MDISLYNLKIIRSGNKRIEVYKVNNYAIKTKGESNNKDGRKGNDNANEEEKEIKSKINRKQTLNNARNNIVRLIKCNPDMNTFITLTFKKEVDYIESKKLLKIFFQKLKRHYKDLNLKYLWVLEFGSKNGRLHYHVLTNIPIDIKLNTSNEFKSADHKALENNFSNKYWKHGFIDIRKLDTEGNTNIALYVSCYITKDLLDKQLEGYRIYGYSSRTMDKPIVDKIYYDKSAECFITDFVQDYDITYSNTYEVGYTDKNGRNHSGTITYFDMKLKEEN